MTEEKVLVHTMTFKPKKNRKLQIRWVDGDNKLALIFKRMLNEGESPEEPTCSIEHRLGVKTTTIGISDDVVSHLIYGLSEYLKEIQKSTK